jgi:hypothetical protein
MELSETGKGPAMTTRDLLTACYVVWIIRLRLLLAVRCGLPLRPWQLSEHQLDCAYRACVGTGLRWLAVELLTMRPQNENE